jgi:hypothetical protein
MYLSFGHTKETVTVRGKVISEKEVTSLSSMVGGSPNSRLWRYMASTTEFIST